MEELKNLIQKNRGFIDDIEPLPGHLDRFDKKLNQKENIRTILYPFMAAASIAIFVTIVLFSIKINYENQITLGDISLEYKDAEIYYQNMFLTEYNTFYNNTPQSSTIKNRVEFELKLMDDAYEQLMRDFRTNPYDTRVINAIITYYQTKVEFIKRINEQLVNNEVGNIIENNYEGNRI